MEDKVLTIVYTLFLGIILALFVGVGIQTFYPQPEFPPSIETAVPDPDATEAELRKQGAESEEAFRQFEEDSKAYNRNVSTISLVAAVSFLALSLLLEKRNRVITNGIMLGGLFTLLYSFGRGLASGDSTMTFIAVTIGLAVVLFLGYRRFGRPAAPHADSTTAPAASVPGPGPGTPPE